MSDKQTNPPRLTVPQSKEYLFLVNNAVMGGNGSAPDLNFEGAAYGAIEGLLGRGSVDALMALSADFRESLDRVLMASPDERKAFLAATTIAHEKSVGFLKAMKDRQDPATQPHPEAIELRAQLADRETTIAALENQVAALQGQVKKAQSDVARKAVELIAKANHQTLPKEYCEGDGKSLLEQFNAITDPLERGRFYAQHAEQMLSQTNQ